MTLQDAALSHLDESALVRYLDGAMPAGERATIEAHLAGCAECLGELIEVKRILRTQPRNRWKTVAPLATAAAALLIWVGAGLWHPDRPVTRDPAFTTTLAPQPAAPLGSVARVDSLVWSPVPGARRYRLTLFATDGSVLWQIIPLDTAAALPDSLRLVAGTTYYWQVKAETAYGRWVDSELESFTLTAVRR
jgi:hypothetical protein